MFRKSAGIPGVAVLVCASKRGARSFYQVAMGMCFGNQRAFRVLQSWSVRAKEEPGADWHLSRTWPSKCTPGLCESGMCLGNQRAFRVLPCPGLVCEKKRSQERWDEHLSRTPGLASCESGLCSEISGPFRVLQSCVAERRKPQDPFYGPAWRSNYFPGINYTII